MCFLSRQTLKGDWLATNTAPVISQSQSGRVGAHCSVKAVKLLHVTKFTAFPWWIWEEIYFPFFRELMFLFTFGAMWRWKQIWFAYHTFVFIYSEQRHFAITFFYWNTNNKSLHFPTLLTCEFFWYVNFIWKMCILAILRPTRHHFLILNHSSVDSVYKRNMQIKACVRKYYSMGII